MKRNRQIVAIGCVAVLAFAACEAGPETERAVDQRQDERTAELDAGALELAPIDHSGVTGTVRADRGEEDVTVTVTLQGLRPEVEYTAHVHDGRCAAGGPVRIPMGRIQLADDGTGRVRLRTETARLPADEPLFVQIHGSGGRAVACADLSEQAGEPTLLLDEDTTTTGG